MTKGEFARNIVVILIKGSERVLMFKINIGK